MNHGCVILFTKAPIPSLVKTRLVDKSSLNIEQATELYEVFLMDVIDTVNRYVTENNFDLVISYTPQKGLNKIKELIYRLKRPIKVSHFKLQDGDTFDQRMSSAFTKAFDAGYQICVAIGGDIPTLRNEHLKSAFEILQNPKYFGEKIIVIGPGIDGGVYLIGLRKDTNFNFRGVFQKRGEFDISLSEIKERASLMSIKLLEINTHYDVDVPEDLKKLKMELSKNRELAPHTRNKLREFNSP
ncbi:TIGR04282 family arsenosugar biosynthesis glycosyltransferase [[Eubacterium] cellulosolvens]